MIINRVGVEVNKFNQTIMDPRTGKKAPKKAKEKKATKTAVETRREEPKKPLKNK